MSNSSDASLLRACQAVETSEVYVQYFSNFCPIARARTDSGQQLYVDSTILGRQTEGSVGSTE